MRRVRAAIITGAAVWFVTGAAAGQTRYLAFGDSITQGVGDASERDQKGYPPRLALLLADAGKEATVINFGRAGETTAEAVSRIDNVLLNEDAEVLLLMEGTNDITERISSETIRFNLDQIVLKAQRVGLASVIATLIPRLPSASVDGDNQRAAQLASELRNVAWRDRRRLVDPFAAFTAIDDVFAQLYVGGDDKWHPNAAGYDRLAGLFADVLLDLDRVPPVLGRVSPARGAIDVAPDGLIEVELYDFGAGIDLGETELLVNGFEVDPNFSGDRRRYLITYLPPAPLSGRVFVELRTRDLADPANASALEVTDFTVTGAELLSADVDRSGRVDGTDLVLFAIRFGAGRGDLRYSAIADFNRDGLIDGSDLAVLASQFGRSTP